jgi:hypothetical protein
MFGANSPERLLLGNDIVSLTPRLYSHRMLILTSLRGGREEADLDLLLTEFFGHSGNRLPCAFTHTLAVFLEVVCKHVR